MSVFVFMDLSKQQLALVQSRLLSLLKQNKRVIWSSLRYLSAIKIIKNSCARSRKPDKGFSGAVMRQIQIRASG